MGTIYRPTYKDKKTGEVKESAVWWIKYYRNGVCCRESSETASYAEAKKILARHEGDIAKGIPVNSRMGKILFSDLAADMVNDYKANHRRTLKDLQGRLDNHVLPYFGARKAASITPADIRDFIIKRQEKKATNGEINRELTAIKRAFSLGAQGGRILFKPYIPMLKENNTRTGFFELPQYESVLAHLPEDIQPMISFAYITGWRIRSEIMPLQWRQVDFAAGIVCLEVGTTKNMEARTFPMTEALRAVLGEQRARTDEQQKKKGCVIPWVFHRKGVPIREFKRRWLAACKKAGLAGKIPHDFRRTAVRNLVRAGVPERVAMQMTGHKTRSVFDRYNIVSEGDLFEAAKKLDAVTGKVTGKVKPFSEVKSE